MKIKWTLELLQNEADKYESRSSFKKNSIKAYNAAIYKKVLDQVCSSMKYNKKKVMWTLELLQNESTKYSTRNQFRINSGNAYHFALIHGMLDIVCKHMSSVYKNWSDETIRKEALKYNSRKEFEKCSSGAYQASRRRGINDSVCAHMIVKARSWTDDELYNEALKYSYRKDFSDGSTAYQVALRRGILDKICAHMKSKLIFWDDEMLQKEALKYKYRGDFCKRSSSAYVATTTRGIMGSICSHMDYLKTYWTNESITMESQKYTVLSDFIKNNYKCYDAASKRGILDKICSHMDRGCGGFNPNKDGILYYLRINSIYKIGISNKTVNERFLKRELDKITVIKVWNFKKGQDALDIEQHILSEFKKYQYCGKKIIQTGNTELFDRDVLCLDDRKTVNNE